MPKWCWAFDDKGSICGLRHAHDGPHETEPLGMEQGDTRYFATPLGALPDDAEAYMARAALPVRRLAAMMVRAAQADAQRGEVGK